MTTYTSPTGLVMTNSDDRHERQGKPRQRRPDILAIGEDTVKQLTCDLRLDVVCDARDPDTCKAHRRTL